MSTPLLTTKLYHPLPREYLVPRPRLIEQLDAGLHKMLTLVTPTEIISDIMGDLHLAAIYY
jgi:ATP/maltotriose-dependent transcriptional regulator MalT